MNLPFLRPVSSSTTSTAPLHPTPTAASLPTHPYYPLNVQIPGYVAGDQDPALLGVSFGAVLSTLLLGAYLLSYRVQPSLPLTERLTIIWFTLCGLLHCFFESYFVANHARLGPDTSLPAQLWKEYALSDSRYLTSDPTVLCMEAITVLVWGPLCLLSAVLITKQHPLRHPFQIIVSIAHLYGCAIYYATSFYEDYFLGVQYSRPEWLYFWIYYFGFNLPWIIVPGLLLYQSATATKRAFEALEKINGALRLRARGASATHNTRSVSLRSKKAA